MFYLNFIILSFYCSEGEAMYHNREGGGNCFLVSNWFTLAKRTNIFEEFLQDSLFLQFCFDNVPVCLQAMKPIILFQVCDNEWHHYAVEVQFPNVQLYVDGVLFRPQKKNPEVIDDWPLHPTADINTTLTVGACWQGS